MTVFACEMKTLRMVMAVAFLHFVSKMILKPVLILMSGVTFRSGMTDSDLAWHA